MVKLFCQLCCGEWNIKVKDKTLDIPSDKKQAEMGTFKEYRNWHFEDWNEVWERQEYGMMMEEWIAENKGWILKALENAGLYFHPKIQQEVLEAIYEGVNAEDWVHGSCGGCI